jgi:enoyl-CoA hydratase/carnithine racemase
MSDEQRVSMTVTDGIADVHLARPDKRNAVDGPMIDAIIETQATIAADGSIRVVVLSGDGHGFCAGLDMASFADMASGDLTSESDEVADAAADLSPTGAARPQLIGWGWRDLPQPVIAALHGAVMGAGLHIALGADIRYVTPDVRMAFVETGWGLVPDISPMQSLRRLVRLDVIKELIMTSREVAGPEAVTLGLATRCTETPLDDALATARIIADKSPDAMRAAKHLANASGLGSVADGLALELRTSLDLMGTPNQIEAVMAQLEGRAPNFEPPTI